MISAYSARAKLWNAPYNKPIVPCYTDGLGRIERRRTKVNPASVHLSSNRQSTAFDPFPREGNANGAVQWKQARKRTDEEYHRSCGPTSLALNYWEDLRDAQVSS
jgi:hypothetical protein